MSIADAIQGALPPSWRLTTVGALCDESGGEVQTGPFGSQLHAEDYVPDGIPSVMPKDIIGGRISNQTIARVPEADAERLAPHRLRAGDIVYARRGDIGRRALVTKDEEGWLCGTGCLRIRLGKADLTPDYLLAYLGHPALRSWVEAKAQGATMLNLNTSILRAVPLRVPPLPEQRRIADILDKADAIRRKRKQAIALTEELLRSAFLDMFGDPVTNPKGWEVRGLCAVCSPKQWPTLAASQLSGSGYPVFGANGVIGYHSHMNHAEPTVLITCRGATCGTINVCMPNSYVTGNSMALDDPDRSMVTPGYLEWVLRLRGLADSITGSAQPQITRQSLQ